MADERIQMPTSGGGLVRYSDDSKSRIQISPMTVVIFTIIIAVFEITLFYFF